ncbi:MAG: sugar ABC transporter substrate-binding protein [Xanthobacteraceae bacterium]
MNGIRKSVSHARRQVLKAAAAAFAVTALASPGAFAQGAPAADKPVELRIMANESYANLWRTFLVPEFNKTFKNIKVTIDGVPYAEQLAKMMLDATSPTPSYDVLLVDDPWIPQMSAIGALMDLKGKEIAAWTAPDYDWADFHPAPLAAGEWKGVQYGIPIRSNMLLMFYNRTLYKKAGLPEPTPKLTWDEFFAQAPKLVQDTKGSGKPDAWAVDTYFVRNQLTPTIWQAILNSNGGRLLDDKGKAAFNSEAGIKSLDMHRRLLDFAPPGALSHGFTESLQAFRQGVVAVMFQWGSGFKASAVDEKSTTLKFEEVGIQVMPVGSAMAGTHRGIWNISIGAKSQNKQAAWAFLQWLSSKQGETFNLESTGGFPARKSTLAAKPDSAWLVPVLAALRQAYDVAEKGQMWRIRHPKSDAAQQILADEVARALAGQVSSAEALKTAATKIDRTLR